MNSRLILHLALVLGGGLFGCSRTPLDQANNPEPKPPVAFEYRTVGAKEPMHMERQRHVAANCGGGRVAIFGGFANRGAELFEVASQTFRELRYDRVMGDFTGIALADGRVLLVDGVQDCVYDPAIEKLLPAKNAFTDQQVRWAQLLRLPDGKVFVCGGFDRDFKPVAGCALFDPRTDSFEMIGKLTVPRAGHTISLINDHEVLVAGGTGADYLKVSFDTLEIFNLTTRKAKLLEVRLNYPRANHFAVTLRDGQILFGGGYCHDQGEEVGHTAEVFDPLARKMSVVGKLALGRGEPEAIRLPSGRVAVFGGADNIRAVEVYDPGQRKFALAGQLMIDPRRSGFTATPLDTGEVLLVGGGCNSTKEDLDRVEIFSEHKYQQTGPARQTVEVKARPRLPNPDPEVQSQAETVLQGIRGGQADHWCVEIWRDTRRIETLWFRDHPVEPYKDEKDECFSKLRAAIDKSGGGELRVRFPSGFPYVKQVQLFNHIGWLRTPVVYLGAPL